MKNTKNAFKIRTGEKERQMSVISHQFDEFAKARWAENVLRIGRHFYASFDVCCKGFQRSVKYVSKVCTGD